MDELPVNSESTESPPPSPPTPARRPFWRILLIVELLVLLFHLPSIRAPHDEVDESVFVFLSERMADSPLQYNVQGALVGDRARRFVEEQWVGKFERSQVQNKEEIIRRLRLLDQIELLLHPLIRDRYVIDPQVHDHPLFIHPPFYPIALVLFRGVFGIAGGPILSILAHLATIALVALLGREWLGDEVGLVAAGLIAIDPISWLAGSHLWIDACLAMNVTFAAWAATKALRTGKTVHFFLAGLALSLACVTKYPAVFVAPGLAVLAWIEPRRPTARNLLAFGGGAMLLIVPWVILFRVVYGAWLPDTRPTEMMLQNYPYLNLMIDRPWHFYVSGLFLVAPVLLFAFPALLDVRRDRRLWPLMAWFVTTVVMMTVLSLMGSGFQLRYLAPGMPAICLLAAVGLLRRRSAIRFLLAGVLAWITFVTGIQQTHLADPFPSFLLDYGRDIGLPIEWLKRGMW